MLFCPQHVTELLKWRPESVELDGNGHFVRLIKRIHPSDPQGITFICRSFTVSFKSTAHLGVNHSAAAAVGAQERRRGCQRAPQLPPHHGRGDDCTPSLPILTIRRRKPLASPVNGHHLLQPAIVCGVAGRPSHVTSSFMLQQPDFKTRTLQD